MTFPALLKTVFRRALAAGLLLVPMLCVAADASPKDSDHDGISDIDEARIYRTDSQLADTDADGLSDGDEILVYFSNPLQRDSDADGYLDGVEVRNHSDPTDATSVPAPTITDLDGDGLSDREEKEIGSDPQLVDSDFDGLRDDEEVNEYFTNPTSVDTDGDGFWDGEEVQAGTDPADAESHPASR